MNAATQNEEVDQRQEVLASYKRLETIGDSDRTARDCNRNARDA